MKINILKYILVLGLSLIIIACSTRRDTFVSRNSHALSTQYNILYNGGLALDKGILELKSTYNDDFWEPLPIERMQIKEEDLMPGQTKNSNFERAETKAIKAIQKHSMNIGERERNPQIDEAHLMLGKARYYDQRFVPALEAFNYVLYKYPNSDKIYEAKVWREKTNIRMENDALAIKNLKKLLKEIKFKDQIFADANAILSQAFLNLAIKDTAIEKLKLATKFTKINEEKARYRFILAQIYEQQQYKDSAFSAYQSVIDMKRKSPRQYVIYAHVGQAKQFDFKNGDTLAFVKKYNKLLKDRENRPFLDILNHQLGLFYDKQIQFNVAKNYYNKSLKSKSQDLYLKASNYRNIGEIFFKEKTYETAGKYYDSTLVLLNKKKREYASIKRKRENLVDVILYEGIAKKDDSILNVLSLNEAERNLYYEKHIAALKKAEALKKALAEKAAAKNNSGNSVADLQGNDTGNNFPPQTQQDQTKSPNLSDFGQSDFYFYNAKSVAYGKTEFVKKWGNRLLKNNWRYSGAGDAIQNNDSQDETNQNDSLVTPEKIITDQYSTEFYTEKLPKSKVVIDSIAKERNFAYYQLGIIYKEKFKEYELAINKLETLLKSNPEERLIIPSMYNLYKIYEIINPEKANAIKEEIVNKYPESRYAKILTNQDSNNSVLESTPESTYNKYYKSYLDGDYRNLLSNLEVAIEQYTAEEIISKFELLKANAIGKVSGIEAFKKALNFVALTYPNSIEGKNAEAYLVKEIPVLEKFKYNDEAPKKWKIVFKVAFNDDKNNKIIEEKINKYIKDNPYDGLKLSKDIYTLTDDFVVIHGIISEEYAQNIITILKDHKNYKITTPAFTISNYNYKVLQFNKNLEVYQSVPKETKASDEPSKKEETIDTENKEIPENESLKNNENIENQEPTEQIEEVPAEEQNKEQNFENEESNPMQAPPDSRIRKTDYLQDSKKGKI